MNKATTYQGSCFCGAVQFSVTGEPVAMGYCHCNDCRHWAAAPVSAFCLWPGNAVNITSGAKQIETYNKTPHSSRKWCKTCGGHVFTEHPDNAMFDVYPVGTPDFPYTPAVHVFYGERVMDVKDGLPKMKDLPADFGGSGEMVAE